MAHLVEIRVDGLAASTLTGLCVRVDGREVWLPRRVLPRTAEIQISRGALRVPHWLLVSRGLDHLIPKPPLDPDAEREPTACTFLVRLDNEDLCTLRLAAIDLGVSQSDLAEAILRDWAITQRTTEKPGDDHA